MIVHHEGIYDNSFAYEVGASHHLKLVHHTIHAIRRCVCVHVMCQQQFLLCHLLTINKERGEPKTVDKQRQCVYTTPFHVLQKEN